MSVDSNLWFLLRLALLACAIFAGFAHMHDPNMTWIIAISFSVGSAILSFISLMIAAYKPSVDWSDPYSFTEPFFPLTRYPMRFWLLLAVTVLTNGIVSLARDLFFNGTISPDSGMPLFSGLSILAASAIFWLSPTNIHNRNGRTRD
jgi:hypothetical protein